MNEGKYAVLVEPVYGEEWELYGSECSTEDEAYTWAYQYTTEEPRNRWALVEVVDTSTAFAEREDEWEENEAQP